MYRILVDDYNYQSSPLDYDGDEQAEQNIFPSTKSSLQSVFSSLGQLVGDNDDVFVFITDHGIRRNNTSYIWETVPEGYFHPWMFEMTEDTKIEYFSDINNFQMPHYFRLDIGGAIDWKAGRCQHKVYLGVYNATNRHNPLSLIYDIDEQYGIKVAEGLRGKRKDRGKAPVFSDMSGNTIRDDS